MDYDGFQKITEYIMIETVEEEIIEIEQKVTYIETDGTEREYYAKGDGESIEIIMPDTQEIDVNYAKDSISDLDYDLVIVGVRSEDGVLIIPEDTVPLVVEYGYYVSISTPDIHVILENDVVKNLENGHGDVKLYVHEATKTDMTDQQIIAIGDNYAISVILTVNNVRVHELGGLADISVLTDQDDALVFYVADDGTMTRIDSTYEYDRELIDFSVDHFSIYMISEEKEIIVKDFAYCFVILVITLILMFLPLIYIRWYERD